MADAWVRLGMALVVIALVSAGLYQFSGRAGAVELVVNDFSLRR